MLASLWTWLVGLFTKEKIGILFVLLFKAGASAIAEQIADKNLHKKALETTSPTRRRRQYSTKRWLNMGRNLARFSASRLSTVFVNLRLML